MSFQSKYMLGSDRTCFFFFSVFFHPLQLFIFLPENVYTRQGNIVRFRGWTSPLSHEVSYWPPTSRCSPVCVGGGLISIIFLYCGRLASQNNNQEIKVIQSEETDTKLETIKSAAKPRLKRMNALVCDGKKLQKPGFGLTDAISTTFPMKWWRDS